MGTSHTVRQALAQASRWTLACSLAVVSSALTSSCASVYDAYSPGTLGALDTQSLPPPDPKVPATILLEEEVVRFGEDPNGEVVARILDRSQIRIHTAAGQGYRGAAIGYSSTFSTVEAFDARITAPNGSSVVVDGAGAVDVPSLGSYVLYDDSRTRRLPVPTVAPGSVVEQASIQRMHSPELFAFAFFFGSSIAMDRGRFVVEVPQGWEIEVQSSRPEAPAAIVTTTAEGLRRYTWERTDLPRLRSDRYSPWIGELGEFVSVRLKEATRRDGTKVKGPVDDVDLSRTSAALMAKQARVTPALEGVVKEVLGDSWSAMPERERAARLYAWTRDSIRYCAVEIGLGGWVPHASDEVERLRYGDCKDKANLLKALLKIVDVKSRLVTIYSSVAPRPFRLPVIAANFNHAILVVDLPDGPAFVDPTTRTVAFADLPPNDEDRTCLPIDDEGTGLTTTPRSSPETDLRQTAATLTATDDGSLVGQVRSAVSGHFADSLRDDFLETPEADHAKMLVKHLALTGTIEQHSFEAIAPPIFVTPVGIGGTWKMDWGGDDAHIRNLVRAVELVDLAAPRIDPNRPDTTLNLWARDRVVDDVAITLPAGMRVSQLPAAAAVVGPLVSYQVAWRVDDTDEANTPKVLRLHHEFTFHENRIPADQVAALRSALEGYFRAMEARVVLERAPVKAAVALEATP